MARAAIRAGGGAGAGSAKLPQDAPMGRPPKARGAGGAGGGRKAAKGGRRWSWTPDRCNEFNEVVKALGGREKATPKFILKHLKARGGDWGKINWEQVHSHLQYLRWVLRNPNQVQKAPGNPRKMGSAGTRTKKHGR